MACSLGLFGKKRNAVSYLYEKTRILFEIVRIIYYIEKYILVFCRMFIVCFLCPTRPKIVLVSK